MIDFREIYSRSSDIYNMYRDIDLRRVLFDQTGRTHPSGRDRGLDSLQPVFGYFSGGGWAFGQTEGDHRRFTPDSYDRYIQGGPTIVLDVYDEYTGQIVDHITIQTTRPDEAGYVEPFNELRATDVGAVRHDRDYMAARDLYLRGAISAEEWRARQDAADRDLIGYWESHPPEAHERNPATQEYDEKYRALAITGLKANRLKYQKFGHCFGAGALISMADGSLKAIEAITPGDLVLAYEPLSKNWNLKPQRVAQIFSGRSERYLKVKGSYVTEGHSYLNEFGNFEPIVDIIGRGGYVRTSSGESIEVRTLVDSDFSRNKSHGVALTQAQSREIPILEEIGVYNFEVENYHNYVVDGLVVHNDSVLNAIEYGILRLDLSDLLSATGSVIGSYLGGDDPLAQIALSATLTTILERIGSYIEIHNPNWSANDFETPGLGDTLKAGIGEQLWGNLKAAGIGAISSYLAGEITAALGVDGLLGEAATSVGGQVIGKIASNLLSPGTEWNAGINAASLLTAIGSWAGARLAHEIGNFNTVGGQIGAAIGTLYGTYNAAATLSAVASAHGLSAAAYALANPVAALMIVAVIVFVNTLIGGYIGTLLNGGPAKSWATVSWDDEESIFAVTNVHSKRGGSEEFATNIASAVAEVINSVISVIGARLVGGADVRGGDYGQRGEEAVYWSASPMVRRKDPEEIVKHGAFVAISDAVYRLAGGSVIAKRALFNAIGSPADRVNEADSDLSERFNIDGLIGNLQLAIDYEAYIQNRAIIDGFISAAPTSEFAVGWILTIAAAYEGGLHRRAVTDWIGGYGEFVAGVGSYIGADFTAAGLSFDLGPDHGRMIGIEDKEGFLFDIVGDSILSGDKDVVQGSGASDVFIVSNGALTSYDAFSINGAQTSSGWDISVAAVIYAGDGNDTVYAGDLGNDVLGGMGNDILVGGKLDDWLFGEDGNDTLRSSEQVVPGAYLSGGSNGDYLDGGAGSDALHGDAGSQWLAGGDGDDAVLAWAGGDIIDGGAGTDGLYGQEGSDQYLFGLGSGWDYVYDDGNAPAPPTVTSSGLINNQAGRVATDVLKALLESVEAGTTAKNWLGDSVDPLAGGKLANGIVADFLNGQPVDTPEEIVPIWAKAGDYEVNGDVRGGEDAIAFKAGIGMGDLFVQRGGTVVAGMTIPGGADDLVIQLLNPDSERSIPQDLTGDVLVIQNWFTSSLTRVEWLRFADGEEVRIGDAVSIINGTNGPDTLIGTSGSDFIYGYDGDDELHGLAGADVLNAGRGKDFASGGSGNDWVIGGMDDDKVWGDSGVDYVSGDSGNDFVYGGAGNDRITGGKGDDRIMTGAGDDLVTYRKGDGHDVITDEAAASDWEAVWVDGAYVNGYALQPDGTVMGQTDSSPWSGDRATYYDGNKWIGEYYYNSLERTYYRYIAGAARFNEVDSPYSGMRPTPGVVNAGTDTVQFGVGIDIQDLMLKRVGNSDYLWAISDENSIASFDSVEDTLRIVNVPGAISPIEYFVFNATGRIQISQYQLIPWYQSDGDDDIRALYGTAPAWLTGNGGDDYMAGSGFADLIIGGAGSDVIYGGQGDDKIWGGAGDDVINAGLGADVIMGGEGFDIVSYVGDGAVTINLSTGQSGADQLFGIEGVEGSLGNDSLTGNAQRNVLRGSKGNDLLQGDAGDDDYEWDLGDGQDTIGDSAGTDVLQFGAGVGLSDLTAARSGADVVLAIGGTNAATLTGQSTSTVIETIAFNDGLTADLTALRVVGEAGGSGVDLMVGGGGGDSLRGWAGDDVLSGGAGADTLMGDEGDDLLEGGTGADVFDGGSDSVSNGLTPSGAAAYGDTVRYVRSGAAVNVNLATRSFSGGDAAGDSVSTYTVTSTVSGYNAVRWSQNLDNWPWYAWNSSVAANALAAPDGTTTAEKVVASTDNNWHTIGVDGVALYPGGVYTASAYVKAEGITTGILVFRSNDDAHGVEVAFNLATGQITGTSANGEGVVLGGAITPEANGYYRVSVTGRVAANADSSKVIVVLGNSGFAGDGVSGLGVWGVQVEPGATVGAYTPTASTGVFPTNYLNNAVVKSQELDSWVWSLWQANVTADAAVAPDGTTTADKLAAAAANDWHVVSQSGIGVDAGQVNTASVYVKAAGMTTGRFCLFADGGWDGVYCDFDLATGQLTSAATMGSGQLVDATITAVGNGYYRIVVSGQLDGSSSSGRLELLAGNTAFLGDGTSGLYYWGAQVTPGAEAKPYTASGWTPAVAGQAATSVVANAVRQSQTLDAWEWYAWNGVVQADAALAPDGSMTADKVVASTANDWHDIGQDGIAITAGGTYTVSAYVKAAGLTTGVLELDGANAADRIFVGFDLATGQIDFSGANGAGTLVGASITAAQNGYYRVSVTGKVDTTSTSAKLHMLQGQNGFAGDGVSGLYFWGVQIEPGAEAGTYTPTTGSPAATLVGGMLDQGPMGTFATVENITGSDGFGDVLTGDARANRLAGLGGDDTLDGGAGDDVLGGDLGNDTLQGGEGDDALSGGLGQDTLYGGAGKDLASGGDGDDALYGEAGDDQLTGDGGNDAVYGGDGADTLGGSDGADWLSGDAGADKIAGGAGADQLFGGDGDDVLSGDAGNDYVAGGAGNDVYAFDEASGFDTVVDTSGTNKVHVAGATHEQIWFQRVGLDLRISTLGGGATAVIYNYYGASGQSLAHAVSAGGRTIFLKYAQPLIDAMSSATVPSAMPDAVKAMLNVYWHVGDKAAPRAPAEVSLFTEEDINLVDQLVAVDHDENIPSTGAYSIVSQGALGDVSIGNTGVYTYVPDAEVSGDDSFQIKVTDADGQSAVQTVKVTILPVNDGPRDIVFTPTGSTAERNRPAADQSLPVQVLGLLSAVDVDGPASPLVALDYSVSDSRFVVIDTGSGPALALKEGQSFDFETEPTVAVTVSAVDSTFNKLLNSDDLTSSPWYNTAYPATITANQGAGRGGAMTLERVAAPNNGGASGITRHAAFQAVAGAVQGQTYTVSFYARADGANPYLWVGDTGDVQGSVSLWNTASFDLSGAGSVRAKNANVDAAIQNLGSGLYRVSVTFTRAASGNFQIVAGPDRATSSIVEDGVNSVLGWEGSGESILAGDGQLETGSSASSYVPSASAAGAIAFSKTLTLQVSDQVDYLYGQADADTLSGQEGRDVIYGGSGGDQIFGMAGNDDLYGEIGSDTLFGGLGADKLYGASGDDLLDGGAGADQLDGGAGGDKLFGGEGDDALFGGDDNDELSGGFGVDTLDGGDGSDFASYIDAGTGGLTVSLDTALSGVANTGMAADDTFTSIENLKLSAGADIGNGDNNANILMGLAGDDVLRGFGGDDILQGGDGVDTLYGGAGSDTLYGDAESDPGGADVISGGAGDDTVYGRAGNDLLNGEDGSDLLYGDAGDDTINGGLGNDRIWGGRGDDLLSGGEGSDTYIIDTASGADTIVEYDPVGADIDALGYQDGIARDYLWFTRFGDDLVISVVGTAVTTTVQDWYLNQSGSTDVRVEYIAAGAKVTHELNADALVALMAGYTQPTTTAEFDALHANASFQAPWLALWDDLDPPVIAPISAQTVAEDGVITVNYTVSDDISNASVVMSASSPNGQILSIVQPGSNGQGSLQFKPASNFSGSTTIALVATAAGGLQTPLNVNVTVTPVADAPYLSNMPATVGTLDSGSLPLVIPAALADADGSESLTIRISGVPSGLSLNQGAYNSGTGVWTLSQADLTGLALVGPAVSAQNLVLQVEATSTEPGATPQTQSVTKTWSLALNARPTAVTTSAGLTVAFAEKSNGTTAWAEGTRVADLQVTDPDGAGDTPTFYLTNDGGGRFKAAYNSATGKWELQVKNGLLLDYDDVANRTVAVTVQAVDSGGLSKSQAVTVNLTDLNDSAPTAPIEIALSPAAAYGGRLWVVGEASNYLNYNRITGLQSTDADSAGLTYQIAPGGDPWGLFKIVGNELQLNNPNAAFDFDTRAASNPLPSNVTITDVDNDGNKELRYVVSVRATDGTFASNTLQAPLWFEDYNEAPRFAASSYAFSVNYRALNGGPNPVAIGSIGAPIDLDWDPANRNVVSYISGYGAGSIFGYNSASGQLTYLLQGGTGVYSLTARARDQGGGGAWTDTPIAINVYNNAPVMSATTWTMDMGANPFPGYASAYYVSSYFSVSDENTANVQWFVDATGTYWDTSGGMFAAPANGAWGTGPAVGGTISQYGYLSNGQFYNYAIKYDIQLSAYDEVGAHVTRVYAVDSGTVSFLAPIVFDLGGAVDNKAAPNFVSFKTSADAAAAPVEWIRADQGFLFLDRNGNGKVDDGSEISFTQDKTGAVSDLEGLAAYDTNADRILNARDARFSEFKVWQDANQDGVSQAGELKSLAEAGIQSLDLVGKRNQGDLATSPTSLIYATTSFTRTDGSRGTAYDTMLATHAPTIELLAQAIDDKGVSERVAESAAAKVGESRNKGGQSGDAPVGTILIDLPTASLGGKPAEAADAAVDGAAAPVSGPAKPVLSLDFGADPKGRLSGAGAGQGFLVYDQNQNGLVDGASELTFSGGIGGAQSGLGGLKAFDVNGDQRLDAKDAAFKRMSIWQDANGDGLSQASELRSLASAGVTSLDLASAKPEDALADGATSAVVNTLTVKTADGKTTTASDVVIRAKGAPPVETAPQPVGQPPPNVPANGGKTPPAPPQVDPATVEAGTSLPGGGTVKQVWNKPSLPDETAAIAHNPAAQAGPAKPVGPPAVIEPPRPPPPIVQLAETGAGDNSAALANVKGDAAALNPTATPPGTPAPKPSAPPPGGQTGSTGSNGSGSTGGSTAPNPPPEETGFGFDADDAAREAAARAADRPSKPSTDPASIPSFGGDAAAREAAARAAANGSRPTAESLQRPVSLTGQPKGDEGRAMRTMSASPELTPQQSIIQETYMALTYTGVAHEDAIAAIDAALQRLNNSGAAATALAVREGGAILMGKVDASAEETDATLRSMLTRLVSLSQSEGAEAEPTDPGSLVMRTAFNELTAAGAYMTDASAALQAVVEKLNTGWKQRGELAVEAALEMLARGEGAPEGADDIVSKAVQTLVGLQDAELKKARIEQAVLVGAARFKEEMESWRQAAVDALRNLPASTDDERGVSGVASKGQQQPETAVTAVSNDRPAAESAAEESWLIALRRTSALDQGLSVAEKSRLLMVEAMASFNPGAGAAPLDSLSALAAANAAPLLTALPRVGAI